MLSISNIYDKEEKISKCTFRFTCQSNGKTNHMLLVNSDKLTKTPLKVRLKNPARHLSQIVGRLFLKFSYCREEEYYLCDNGQSPSNRPYEVQECKTLRTKWEDSVYPYKSEQAHPYKSRACRNKRAAKPSHCSAH